MFLTLYLVPKANNVFPKNFQINQYNLASFAHDLNGLNWQTTIFSDDPTIEFHKILWSIHTVFLLIFRQSENYPEEF